MNKFAEISSNKNPADLVPHSIEAEQQLLGGILNNNDLFYSLEDKIKGEHFYDPVHSRIFDVIANRINEGKLASAVTVSTFLTEDEDNIVFKFQNYINRGWELSSDQLKILEGNFEKAIQQGYQFWKGLP